MFSFINLLRDLIYIFSPIKLNINDKLVEYLVKEGGVPIKGIPSSFMLINIGLKVLNLSIVI